MSPQEKEEVLEKFKIWFKDSLIVSHKKNTQKLVNLNEFNINPFLLYYLSNFLEGNSEPKSLAKALIYPRVLGTSITTSFGTQIQSFITKVLNGYGSIIKGIDIEFIDQTDGRRKYCQLKSGPMAINRDDVTTIKDHFKGIKNLARTNSLDVQISDTIFCLLYGEKDEKNAFILEVEKEYPVYIGKEFWHRFTGDENFYNDLIQTIVSIAKDVDMKSFLDEIVDELSIKLKEKYKID
jgi:hypothetical protein